MKRQEWDFPEDQRPRRYRVLEAEPEQSGWGSPTATKVIGAYWTIVKTVLKVVLGAILGGVLIGCAWMMSVLMSLPK
jgi:hypothetical protein